MNEHKRNEKGIRSILSPFYQRTSAEQRYASFDICFLYFQTHRHSLSKNMELSCLHLWGYLASWGMLRGSSKLLQECSMKALSGVVEYLSGLEDTDWELDLGLNNEGERDEQKAQQIITIYKGLVNKIKTIEINNQAIGINAVSTLVTKIMLGTLGCVPALDQFCSLTFRTKYGTEYRCGFRSLTKKALWCIQQFYIENKETLDEIQYSVMDFDNVPTQLLYTKAKLIDMFGFEYGKIISEKNHKK